MGLCQFAVSIHAPARGATASSGYVARYAKFQFTRPQGARLKLQDPISVLFKFQFTRPQGARRKTPLLQCLRSCRFNSRARKGRDSVYRLVQFTDAVSIHAPARGATFHPACGFSCGKVSIHAPARGATTATGHWPLRERVSIHAPARGATRPHGLVLQHFAVSIHAPARGATRVIAASGSLVQFQFTRPQGARQPRKRWFSRVGSFNSRARKGRDVDALLERGL